VDSPGFGGSEFDLMRVLTMVGTEDSAVLHSLTTDPKLLEFFRANSVRTQTAPARGNSWRNALSGLKSAFGNIRKFPKALFIVWSHHLDSNRWLQVALAARHSRFILVERLVPADRQAFARSRLTVPLKRFVVHRAKAAVMVGRSQVAHYSSLFNVRTHRIIAIPNTRPVASIRMRSRELRLSAAQFRKNHGMATDAKLLVCVGRLCAQKNQAMLIEAAARLLRTFPNLYVGLVGDGPDHCALQTLGDRLMSGRVMFVGHSDPLPWLAAADVFILPSLTEGLPGALIEAMAAEVPCVTTDVPGNTELVTHNETGLLVPIGNPAALAAAIECLLSNSDTANRLAEKAYALVANQYDESLEQANWEKLFSELA
jgi:glycosyltransferase involved in cell wall biosynthesis